MILTSKDSSEGKDGGDRPSEKSLSVSIIEAHEEFIQHIEEGRSRIRGLSIVTIVVAVLLGAGYSSQLIYPFATGNRYAPPPDLLDPVTVAFELVLLGLTFVWLYVGVANYLFSARLNRQIREIRASEKELEKRITGS